MTSNALVQLQARYNHCGEAASEKCLSAATFVRRRRGNSSSRRARVCSTVSLSEYLKITRDNRPVGATSGGVCSADPEAILSGLEDGPIGKS